MLNTPSNLISGLWRLISFRQRIRLCILLFVTIFSAVLEITSIAAIYPLLSILANNPSSLIYNLLISTVGNNEYVNILGVLAYCLIVILSAALKTFTIKLNGSIAADIGSSISYRALSNFLLLPYEQFIRQPSSYYISLLTTSINRSIAGIYSTLKSITALILVVLIIIGLLFTDPITTLMILSVLTTAYIIIFLWTKKILSSVSRHITYSTYKSLNIINESLNSFREVVLGCKYQIYFSEFTKSQQSMRSNQAYAVFLSQCPKFLLEAIGFCSLALIGLYVSYNSKSIESTVAILGVYALACQKLLPALQQVYSGWAEYKSVSSDIYKIVNLDLKDTNFSKMKLASNLRNSVTPFEIINICNLSYKYLESSSFTLKNINLSIMAGDKIGIIGKSGSGKSTFIDVVSGLLKPSKGKICIDNVDINSSVELSSDWSKGIGYVSQNYYLLDASFSVNISMNSNPFEIDMEKLVKATRVAQIHDYIESTPLKYDTIVGENAIKLSGGQKQRLAIARALYSGEHLLIFDEATSALDLDTENLIVKAIDITYPQFSIIMVAHRLSSLKNCNKIIQIEDGCIVNTFSSLGEIT